jgi:predicted dehydrogenase
VNWLVVGIGDITTRRVIPAILAEPRSNLHGVVTRTREKGLPYSDRVWESLGEALRDPAIDAVYVATPVALHAPQTVASLRAGKHVLCEKPVAMNYAEAREMAREAQANGRVLGVAYYRRMYPKVRRAKELIGRGAVGKPVLAELSMHTWFDPADGFRGWLVEPELAGGGPLYDIASHRIDLLNFWFGTPARAVGLLSNAVHTRKVEDAATVLVDYENGARGVVDVRWHSRVERDECRIVGTDGEIEMTPLSGPELRSPLGEERLPAHANIHYPCIENFVSAVLEGAPLESGIETAIWTDWITERVKRV